jgi:hypothetical protein
MNLFFLSRTPREAAQAHANKHVVKMVLETAQMLSTAHRLADGARALGLSARGRACTSWVLADAERERLLYRATHANHPTAAWVRGSRAHYDWAFSLFCELLSEYTFRYGKVHACTKLVRALAEAPAGVPDAGFSDPPKCMPEVYAAGDVVTCYRTYYREGKKDLLAYKRRAPPPWLSV